MLLTAALLLAAGCDQKPAPPPAPQATTAPAPTTIKKPATGPAYVEAETDPDKREWREQEALLLKELGQPEARQGDTLTIRRDGKVVLSLTDPENEAWVLTDVITMTRDGVEQIHYEVSHHLTGQVDEPSATLFDQNGVEIETYSDWAIWRGAIAAISWSDQGYDVGSPGNNTLELHDLTKTPHRKYVFKARCNASRWISDTELKVVCSRPALQDASPGVQPNGTLENTDAVVTRVGPNAWRLRELRAPKAKLMDVENNPPTAYDETVEGVAF
ncbi:hypothetical protein [Caulobacter vibrioides]|nr:hypothetical protein [Caulobacter vibrioides]